MMLRVRAPLGHLVAAFVLAASTAFGLPRDPAIPGIPGQKEPLPPTVAFSLAQSADGFRICGSGLSVCVTLDPFGVSVVRDLDGVELLHSAQGWKWTGAAPIAYTQDHGFYWNTFYWGYRGFLSLKEPWIQSRAATDYHVLDDRVCFSVETYRPSRGPLLFVVGPFYDSAVRLAASVPASDGARQRVAFAFAAPEDEHYAGFGERFNRIDQRGRRLECWAEEGSIEPGWLRRFRPDWPPEYAFPGGEDASYAPVPFFLSSRGYGLLADVAEPSHFDMAASRNDLWRVEVEADALSVVVFAGPTPADALRQYTERTGRIQVPPAWMLAPWNMLGGYRQGGPIEVARLFREQDIPSSVAPDWLAILPVPGYRGHEDAVRAQNAALNELGFRTLCYIQPRVDRERCADLWNEGRAQGHFVRNADGQPYVQDVFVNLVHRNTYTISQVDYTHEGADAWWHRQLRMLVDLGFDGTMYDFGEYVPPDALFADGRSGHYWHNPYNLIYLRSGYRFFRELDDDPNDGVAPDFVYFHRSGYAGSQQWAWAMWGGDPEADWSRSDGLPAQVCAGMNVGLSGIPIWGSDTGGFHAVLVPPPTSELVKRWIEFSTFCGLMRDMNNEELRGVRRVRIFDEPELMDIARRYQKLRTQLVPYLMNAAHEARNTGLPIMRAAFLNIPGDDRCWEIDREFMCGGDLYVAPVVEEGARQRTLYLPQGLWAPLWPHSEYDPGGGGLRLGSGLLEGGRVVTVDAPIEVIPVFVRWGAVIPVADPRVDTWAGAKARSHAQITTADDVAQVLHVWAWPHGETSAVLADGTMIGISKTAWGVQMDRESEENGSEVVVQIAWPMDLPMPTCVYASDNAAGEMRELAWKPEGDPFSLEAGSWTLSEGRHSVAFRGESNEAHFRISVK
ncbi:MAG TPA: glycoside hydrolase family 31 protein [Candidatus Hydrogenedentes bacterium]|nr:glycoside hydrolase family 31 protein [Candidatus Hydrogenedentota bacterium]HOZ49305.1 glycoside hydrolase family 31 protein [Candidatus Hydrogenedentota bacterium]HPG69658.1 glycoside hydrolase family 31 protein [Candidatus Hydrogenedentota bacterium]